MGEGNPILIENPEQNPTRFGAFFSEDAEWISVLQESLSMRNITPSNHPKVLELFAGRGPIVATLAQWGWSNLTCIDRAVSPNPIAPPSTSWFYLDLSEMIDRLKSKNDLSQVQFLSKRFDIVTATFARGRDDTEMFQEHDLKQLSNFFCRKSGYVFVAG